MAGNQRDPDQMIDQILSLSLEQKIGQLFFIGLLGPALDETARELLKRVSPGGVCLFARNIREARQTRDLLDAIRAESLVVPFLSLDQEGGLVDRLRRLITPMLAPSKIKDTRTAGEFGSLVAEIVRLLGFNMDFAPVVDVIDEQRSGFSNGLHSRSFGSSADEVVRLAGEFLSELQKNGCLGCVKHFPGLGASEVDSHEELPLVSVTKQEFQSVDLLPYRELLALERIHAVMVAHAAYPKLDLQEKDQNGKLLPASLSHGFVTQLLRSELGFDGLVLTDDLEMGAILKNYGVGEACKLAFAAGVDMLSICAAPDAIHEGYSALLKAVRSGEISEPRINESLVRIAVAKKRLKDPLSFDQARLDELSLAIADLNDRLK